MKFSTHNIVMMLFRFYSFFIFIVKKLNGRNLLSGFSFFMYLFFFAVETDGRASEKNYAFAPALSFELTAEPSVVSRAGTVVEYTYTVTNTGDTTLTGVVVNDDVFGAISLNAAVIEPALSVTGTAVHTISQEEMDSGGELVNDATVSTAEGVQENAGVTVTIEQMPDLAVTNLASPEDYDNVGDKIEYSFEVVNTGNISLTGISVTDDLTGFTDNIPLLAPDDLMVLNSEYEVKQADLDARQLVNTVTASAGDDLTETASVTVNAIVSQKMDLTQTVNQSTYNSVGDVLEFTITAVNSGNVTLDDVTVEDELLKLNTTVPSLVPGDKRTFNETYEVIGRDLNTGSVKSVVNALDDGSLLASNEVIVNAELIEELVLLKNASPMEYDAVGDNIQYTISLENIGNVSLTNLTVTDLMIGLNASYENLAPGATETLNGSYEVTQEDLDAGSVTNTVTASDGGSINETANVSVEALLNPDVTIAVTASPESYDEVGDVINFNITVTNTGNVTLNDISVSDPLIVLNENIESLAPGMNESFSGSYTIEQSDLNAGSVLNTVDATGGGLLDESSQLSVSAIVLPELTVTKTASPLTYTAVGNVIDYDIVVRNTGDVILNNINVVDPLLNLNQTIASMDPGTEQAFQGSYLINEDDIDEGSVTNIVNATADGSVTASADATVTFLAQPGISIDVTASPTSYDSDDDAITYTITVNNTGNVTVNNLTVSSPQVSLTQNIATIAPGDNETFMHSYDVDQDDLDAGTISATFTASDGGSLTASDVVTVTGNAQAALSVTKTTATSSYDSVGDEIDYTITVENTGSVTVTGITVSDPLIGLDQTIASLAPGADQSFTGTYPVDQDDLNAGNVTNTVTVTADGSLTAEDEVSVNASTQAGLSVTKSAAPASYDSVGDEIDYTITVENTGNVTVNGINVSDPLIGLDEDIASLAPGENQTFSGTYIVDQDDLNAGSVSNTATASAGASLTAEDVVTVTASTQPALAVTKTASPTSYDSVGDEIDYTIVVENTGNVTVNNINVSDPLIGLNQNIASLAPGEDATLTGTYTVDQDDLNAGSVANIVTVSDGGDLETSDEVTVSASTLPGIAVTKTASPTSYDSVGDEITYTIVVENTGNVTVNGINVSDPLIGLDENIASLAPGEDATFTGTYTVDQDDLNTGIITNTVTAADDGSLSVSDQVTVNASTQPAIEITKTASPASFNSTGDRIDYTLVVTNTGNVELSNVTVSDQMLDLEETIGTLAAGDSRTFEDSYTITQTDLNNGRLTNIAYVAGDAPGDEVVSDSDEVTVTGSQTLGLIVNKTASPVSYDAVGDVITYTITVENTGNVLLTGVRVTDPMTGLNETIVLMLPGASQTFTETITITQAHLNAGSFTNTVTASGDGPLSAEVSDTDDASVLAIQNPGLTVTKTAAQETFKAVGDEINYTIEVENTGNVTLANVAVSDPLTQLSQTIASLNPGQSQSFSTGYSITQNDLEQGVLINVALASAVFGNQTIEVEGEAVVSALFPPTANDDISSDHISGNPVAVDILKNDLLNDGSPASPDLVTVDLNQQQNGVQVVLQVQGEGQWNYEAESGELNFNPQAGFTTDPSPISYTLTEKLTGLSDAATVTVDYNEGEPFAFNDISTDNTPGEPVEVNIVANDKLSDGSAATVQLITIDIDISQAGVQQEKQVPEEGSWTFNPETGEIVFIPLPGYSTDPTPLVYSLTEDLTGLSDNGTVVIGYDEQPPVAADDNSSGHSPGDEAAINILENDELGDGTPALPARVTIDLNLQRAGIQDAYEVLGEGVWNLDDSTGEVVFTPQAGFTGTPGPVTYRLTEILTGLQDEAVVTLIYSEEAPVAADDTSTGNPPNTDVSINILENDFLSDGSVALPVHVTVDLDPDTDGVQAELDVDGQGLWVYNVVSGVLTFNPESGFFGDPDPISYTLCSILTPLVCSVADVTIEYEQEPEEAAIAFIKQGTFDQDNDIINYSFEVVNTGNQPVWFISIADERIGIINLPILPDTLQPGASGVATATYEVTQEDRNAGFVENSATASGTTTGGGNVEDVSGRTVDDDEPTNTLLGQNASVRVEKQVLSEGFLPVLNSVVDFRLMVQNNGNVVIDNVSLEDPLTGFEQLIGELMPGDSGVYYTSYTVQTVDVSNGGFSNTAIATALAPGDSLVTDSSTVVVDVEQCEMVIPTGFSPNDDGIQDVWRIQCLENYPDARVEIFNRWGNRVFERENFGNTDVHGIADAWWDGYSTNKRTFGSGKLPAGTYYFILYLQDGQEPLNGYVFLNR